MKNWLFLFLLFPLFAVAQQAKVTGTVKDKLNEEAVIGCFVNLGANRAVSDDDGNFVFENVPYGKYKLQIASSEFDTLVMDVVVDKPEVNIQPRLGGSTEI